LKRTVTLLSLFFCLCVVFLSYRSEASTPVGESSPVQPEMLKAPWEHYATDEDGGGYFYNTSTVKHLKGNHVTVQVRAIYSAKKPNYSQAEFLWEIDCSKKSLRGLTANAKKKMGSQKP
jgi:hypothetical protein